MKKLKVWHIIFVCIIVLSILGALSNDSEETSKTYESIKKEVEQKPIICDGIDIIENCELDGVQYLTYKYYPAIEEKSHIETKTTYTKEIISYCTLCNDGTYSPTCATGSGACSHYGGVAQWNAPVYTNVPHYEEIKIIDSPAVLERYEKIVKED